VDNAASAAESSASQQSATIRPTDRTSRPDQSIKFATWNVGSMTGKEAAVTRALFRQGVDICCVQESRWPGCDDKMLGNSGARYKFFWQGCTDGNAGVGILVLEKWIDKVVDVRRLNERVMCIKVKLGECWLNCVFAYAPQDGKSPQEKNVFWDLLSSVVGNMPASEMVVVGGDLNGHVGASVGGYEGVHGGYGFRDRNVSGERILEFCDAVDMVIANTLFEREPDGLVTYVSGKKKTMIDYLLLRRCDKGFIKNVKVIVDDECKLQHRMLLGVIMIKDVMKKQGERTTQSQSQKVKKKLRKTSRKRAFARVMADCKNEVSEAKNVESKWNSVKDAWLKAAEQVCGWTEGPEEWLWQNEEAAKAIEEKRTFYKMWHKTNDESKETRKIAEKCVASAQEKMKQEPENNVDSTVHMQTVLGELQNKWLTVSVSRMKCVNISLRTLMEKLWQKVTKKRRCGKSC